MPKPEWTFLTNHAQVFLCIAHNDHITAREIATIVGITERAVQRIIEDLVKAEYIHRFRDGRSNRYRISLDMPLRHPAQRGQPVRDLLALLLTQSEQQKP